MAPRRRGDGGAQPRNLESLRTAPHPAAVTLAAIVLVILPHAHAVRLIPGNILPKTRPSSTHYQHGSVHEGPHPQTLEQPSEHHDYAALADEQLRLLEQRRGQPDDSDEPRFDAYEDPERLRALRHAFADELDAAGRVRAMSAYREARAQCNWTSTPAAGRLPHQKLDYSRNGKPLADTLVFEKCQVRADSSALEGNFWRIARIGPFKSSGGDWNSFKSLDVGDLSEDLAEGLPFWLTGLSMQVITADGTPVPSPPLHMHHIQLRPSSSWNVTQETRHGVARGNWQRANQVIVDEWGGDRQCSDAEGGTDCFMKTFPVGFGLGPIAPRSRGIALDFITVDVRPDGAEEMEYYAELSLRWTRKTQVPLRYMMSRLVGSDRYQTYHLSEQSTTMSWGASQMPHSARLAHMRGHAHREFYDSMMIFAASPEQLGLVGGSSPLDLSNWAHGNETLELEKAGYSIGGAQAYLLGNLAKSQRACSFHGNCTNTPQLMCAFMEQGREPLAQEGQGLRKGLQWDRNGEHAIDCDPVFINKGDVITQDIEVKWIFHGL